MSLHTRFPKRDANEQPIFAAFKAAGCAVLPISVTGGPDAVIFHGPRVWLVEVKARLGKLTQAQKDFRLTWRGPPIHIVRTVEEALALAKGMRPTPQD